MRFVSSRNPERAYDSSALEPSPENEKEYQRLLRVFNVVADAVRQGRFTTQHTINIDDISLLENRFFGTTAGRYLGTEQSIKKICHNGAPDIIMVQNDFTLAIDHFYFDCTKWTRKGSSLQALLSSRREQVQSFSATDLYEIMNSMGIIFSIDNCIDNLSRLIKRKAEKAVGYFDALDCYLTEEDNRKQKEVWLFAENVLPICEIDLVVLDVLQQLRTCPSISGMIYVQDKSPLILSDNIDDVRFISNIG